MAKLAILILACLAFQTAAAFPRYMEKETLMTTWDFENVDSKTMVMHIDMFFKNFCHDLEHKEMDKETILCCIQKFMRFMDVLCEKLECIECTDKIYSKCLVVCKNIKMECEKMLMFTEVHHMKMEFVRWIRMFCMELKKWCVHDVVCVRLMHKDIFMHFRMMFDNFCIGFDAIRKDICMYFIDFCKMMCKDMNMYMTEDFMTMRHSGMMMMGDLNTMHRGNFNMRMLVEMLIKYCETNEMFKENMMMCMRKFIMIVDFCIEKLCMSDKCNEICMELKNIKMMLERCLSYGMFTNVDKMKMEFCECIKMFYKCMEMWMTCNNCCVGYEMMWRDICMRFESFYHFIFYRMNTHMTRDL